ncbi:RNA polymerase II-associated protein 3-like isoform X1 [Choristoneura fumiferana]|uniref:RNA polymerase II-associated protein 3-like isoform X1 n=2 Tax=Choristoneura fumiferana TaxID=7141 RepID=UPI003D15AA0F
MDKAFEIQRQVRDNVSTLKTYLTDLQNWEVEMKRKEAALNGEFEQDLPPVRSKAKKEKPVEKKKTVEKRLKSSDYKAWDSFDADKACEEIDMEDVGPTSLDGKKSQQAKMEKLREEAHHEKERGNAFVKQEKWDEAIACYNRAIELVKDDAIYYANRGLCYLKKDSLHQAETDCTEALRLDPTYVKALQRRATARERLGSLRAASHDLSEVLKYEPHNGPARKQLEVIKNRMGTKGSKSKSSPSSTPTSENKPFPRSTGQAKIVELKDEPALPVPELSEEEKWKNGVGECITVIKPVKKPPHLRSKRALKTVPILEIPLGKTEPEKPPTRLKIIEIEDDLSKGDTNNNDSNKSAKPNIMDSSGDMKSTDAKDVVVTSPESEKLVKDVIGSEKDVSLENMVPPVNSVQFMAEWKYMKGNERARSDYLSIIDPVKIPSIFDNALESDVLSDLLSMLAADTSKFADKTITAYLKGLTRVKRFSALAMFLSTNDKQILKKLLQHCKTAEHCSENEIADLMNKFEL